MVRRKGGRKRTVRRVCAPAKGSKAKYKKCLIATIRRTKISTPKSAQRAFRAAARRCRAILTGKPARRVKRGRKMGVRRRRRRVSPGAGRSYSRYNLPFEGAVPSKARRRLRRAGLGRYGF